MNLHPFHLHSAWRSQFSIACFHDSTDPSHIKQWSRGCILGSAQNFARDLMETPSNHMTPTMFVEAVNSKIGEVFPDPHGIEVIPRFVHHTNAMYLLLLPPPPPPPPIFCGLTPKVYCVLCVYIFFVCVCGGGS